MHLGKRIETVDNGPLLPAGGNAPAIANEMALIKQVINARIAKAEGTEHSYAKAARWTGYILGPLGSLSVTPYAYSFGGRVATNILRTDDDTTKMILGIYFATIGTAGVSSVASLICGDVFPQIVDYLSDTTLTPIRSQDKLVKCGNVSSLALASICALISTALGAYLTDVVYRPHISHAAVLLDAFCMIVWGTVSVWSLYELPKRGIEKLETSCAYLTCSHSKTARKRAHLLSQFDNHLIPAANNSNAHNFGRAFTGFIGALAGAGAVYFYIPAGKLTGESTADLIHLPDAKKALGYLFSILSFCIQAPLSAYSTKIVFEKTYDKISGMCAPPNSGAPEGSLQTPAQPGCGKRLCAALPYALLTSFIAFSSSAHRIELSAEYAPSGGWGYVIIGLSMLGLASTNYWAFDGLKARYQNRNQPLALSAARRLAIHAEVYNVMSDSLVDAAYSHGTEANSDNTGAIAAFT